MATRKFTYVAGSLLLWDSTGLRTYIMTNDPLSFLRELWKVTGTPVTRPWPLGILSLVSLLSSSVASSLLWAMTTGSIHSPSFLIPYLICPLAVASASVLAFRHRWLLISSHHCLGGEKSFLLTVVNSFIYCLKESNNSTISYRFPHDRTKSISYS